MNNHKGLNLLTSNSSRRAYIIASHIAPYIQKLFIQSNQIQQQNNNEDDEIVEPWLLLTSESPIENDTFFSSILNKTKNVQQDVSIDQLSMEQLVHIIAKTIEALDLHVIEPRHIQILNLQNAHLNDNYYLHLILPKCNQLTKVNLSHLSKNVVNDITMDYLGRYLPRLTSIVVDHCDGVTDEGCYKMFNMMSPDVINSLNALDLSHTGITQQSLQLLFAKLFQGNQQLNQLDCDGICIDKKLAQQILGTCNKLSKIHHGDGMNSSLFRNNILVTLPNMNKQFNVLDLSDNDQITNDVLKNILYVYASPAIHGIILKGATRLDDNAIPIINRFRAKMPNLKWIDLEGVSTYNVKQQLQL
jgi:hypothetical protein